jgi:hypothetical protein
MARSESELILEAIQVQDACNLSGVVHSFSAALSELRALPQCTGNKWLHNHRVSRLYTDKIASLTGGIYSGYTRDFDTDDLTNFPR